MEPLHLTIPDALTRLLRHAPLSPEKVAFAWRTAVGPGIARASAARLSPDGVVEVVCSDDRWRREVRRSLPVIKARLAALLGDEVVRKIKIAGASRVSRKTSSAETKHGD